MRTHEKPSARMAKTLQFLPKLRVKTHSATQPPEPPDLSLSRCRHDVQPPIRQLTAETGWLVFPAWHTRGPYRASVLSPGIFEGLQAPLQQDFPDVKLMLRKQTDIGKAFITRLVCVQVQPRGQAKIGNGALAASRRRPA